MALFGRGKSVPAPTEPEKKEKPTPAYLRDDYPNKAVGEPISDPDSLIQQGVLYEIRCPNCGMSIRTQGCNVKSTYERLLNGVEGKNEDGTTKTEGGGGCIGCGNRELVIRTVDMSGSGSVGQ